MTDTNITPEKKTTKPKKTVAEKVVDKVKATPVKKTAEAKATTAAKSTTKPATKKASTSDLESYYRSIEVAAYFIAELDGFAGNPVDYWIKAEAKIKR